MSVSVSPAGEKQQDRVLLATSVDRPIQHAAGRPRTSHRRLDTSRPETSTSSVGELPNQTFFPDNDDNDLDEAEEEYQTEDDEDADVFAFERPQTAAVGALPQSANSQGNWRGLAGSVPLNKPIVRLATSKSRAPTTAETDRSGSFGFDINRHSQTPDGLDSSPQATDTLDHLPYQDLSNDRQAQGHNINAGAYARRGEDWTAQRPSIVSETLVGRPSTAQTSTNLLPFDSESRTAHGSSNKHGPLQKQYQDKFSRDGIEMEAFQDRPTTRVSWNVSDLHGPTTIPDGVTTKGDGLGGLYPKLFIDDANQGGGVNEEDLDEDSPFPEVRASVSNIDDPDLPGQSYKEPHL
jgi:hypothetical protein